MSWADSVPILVLTALLIMALLVALEIGHRLARRVAVDEHQASTITAPILALVGILLGFSFSMADDRYAERRAAGVHEANSIGTFWLRTSLVPQPLRSEMQSRLRRYVDLHLAHRFEQTQTHELEAEASRLQQELWALLIQDARREPEASRLRLLMPALNTMIDDFSTLLAARDNRLPGAIFLYLVLLILVAGVVVGYRPRDEKRNLLLWAMFTVAVTGMFTVLMDLDRSRRGLIETDVTPYVRLRESMLEPPP